MKSVALGGLEALEAGGQAESADSGVSGRR